MLTKSTMVWQGIPDTVHSEGTLENPWHNYIVVQRQFQRTFYERVERLQLSHLAITQKLQ